MNLTFEIPIQLQCGMCAAVLLGKVKRHYVHGVLQQTAIVEPCRECLDEAIRNAMTTTADFPVLRQRESTPGE